VTADAVSPFARLRLFAKRIIRVLLSTAKGTGAVAVNGSASRFVDSTAMARVEFALVRRTGGVAARWTLVGNKSASRTEPRRIGIAKRREIEMETGRGLAIRLQELLFKC
jgi:hypothetical protein